MIEEIRKVLSDYIFDEQLVVILDVVDTLLTMNYDLALDELTNVIMMADDYSDSAILVSRINDILWYALKYILGTYQVIVTDEATLFQKHAIVKMLTLYSKYILPNDIYDIFSANYDKEETIAHLVPLFDNVSIDEILEIIVSVGDGSFNSIKDTIKEIASIKETAEVASIPVDRIRDINKLIAIVGADRVSMLLELANAGVRVGRPLDNLLEISFEALEQKNAEDAALELIGLTFFSDTPTDKLLTTIQKQFSEYTDNPLEYQMMYKTYQEFKNFYYGPNS